MRNLSVAALAKIAQEKGVEPVLILEIQWAGSATAIYYADKDIPGFAAGKITEVGELDEIVQVSGGGKSEQIRVTLDDTDGALKEIFDTIDVHKKSARVWQWFAGIDIADKFLVFKGQINSPVVWNEGERTLEVAIVNRIEDVEVGFSAEEGQFLFLPDELIGAPWPLCFGTVVNVPALKAVPANSGTLASGVGIKDFTLKRRIGLAEKITCPSNIVGWGKLVPVEGAGYLATPIYQADLNCVRTRCTEIERMKLALKEQTSYEYPTITVFGGAKFAQGVTLTLNINGGFFTGYFGAGGDPETFTITSRLHPKNDGNNGVLEDSEEERTIRTECEKAVQGAVNKANPGQGNPDDDGHAWWWTDPRYLGKSPPSQTIGARSSRITWENYRAAQAANFFWASGGASVRLASNAEIVYIANILPSTIQRVAAWRTVDGNRFLLTVPEQYYTIRQTDFNGYLVMEIVMTEPLSLRGRDTGGGWEDDIYVTMTSSVGPNTVDIIRWFIETYTDYAIDEDSFDACEATVENYPMHFPLLSRRNLITVLQEIATQARCALWQKDDTFYIRYLSETPTPVDTIDEDDIIPKTLQISLSSTEDVVTKLVAKWKKDYALPRQNTLILRHNVKDYGTHEKTFDYYCFNILQLVRKTATYWTIRKSNAWKRVKFSTPLTKLNLESFDAVTLSLPKLASVPVIGIVEKATYNSKENVIDFECWTPVLAGTNVPYDYAFPADINEQALFPRIEERRIGKAGSGNAPNFTVIAPPEHPLRPQDPQTGGSINLDDDEDEREDFGDKNPSDTGDVKPSVDTTSDIGTNSSGDISVRSSPFSGNITNSYFGGQTSANDQAKNAAGNADRAREDAARAGAAAGQDENPGGDQPNLGDLPDPSEGGTDDDDLADDCIFAVQFTLIVPESVSTNKPGDPATTSEPGATGRPAISAFYPGHKVYFDSYYAAVRFNQNLLDKYQSLFASWGFKVGGQYKLAQGVVSQGNSANTCVEPEQPGIVGYRPSEGGGPKAEVTGDEMTGI